MVEDKIVAIGEIKKEFDEYKRQYDHGNEKTLDRLLATERQFASLMSAKIKAEGL